MTAIAYRGGIMAADSQVTGGDMLRGYTTKIVRSPAGTLAACAGDAGTSELFNGWVLTGKVDGVINTGVPDRLYVDVERGCFGAIVVQADGTVTCFDWRGYPIRGLRADFYVEGSAEQILTGAMAAGASAEEAVRIAVKYDIGCGGAVQVERLCGGSYRNQG